MLWNNSRIEALEELVGNQEQELLEAFVRIHRLEDRLDKLENKKAENEVNVIHLYRSGGSGGVWVYNDDGDGPNGRYSRSSEVLVPSITEMIDSILNCNDKDPEDYYDGGLSLVFGRNPVPDYVAKLSRRNGEVDNYLLEEMMIDGALVDVSSQGLVGYLCPAMLDYFADYPDEFYVAFVYGSDK